LEIKDFLKKDLTKISEFFVIALKIAMMKGHPSSFWLINATFELKNRRFCHFLLKNNQLT